jgi:hypothetical protein
MKVWVAILVLCSLFRAEGAAETDAFYVWQQLWSANLKSAIEHEPPTTLYPLACTVIRKGKSSLVAIPWNQLTDSPHHYIPVIRIPIRALKRIDLGEELARVTTKLAHAMASRALTEIQFDVDCPERKLDRYLTLIRGYRQRHPQLKVSITALPVHLKHKQFHELAKATDSFVIQVHGLDVPDHVDAPAALLNRKRAELAIRQADAIGRPYHVAMPCYAYELNFAPDTGAFMFLTAEQSPRRAGTIRKRIAANHQDLIAIQKQIREHSNAKGIIWFRLPVKGDRLCLPRKALATLQSGLPPQDHVECRTHALDNRSIELEVFNGNTIHASDAVLRLNWRNKRGSYDLFHGFQPSQRIPGLLPSEISLPMPPPGEGVKVGWFQASSNNLPTIEIELR